MRIDILTLFPAMFEGFINESIIKRAINKELVEINIIDFSNWKEYDGASEGSGRSEKIWL